MPDFPSILDAQPEVYGALLRRSERVFAFDVFDTLVARTINPEHVKRLSLDLFRRRLGLDKIDADALYELRRNIEAELCQEAFNRLGELEFRFCEMGTRLQEALRLRGVKMCGLTANDFADGLLDCELSMEHSVLQAIPAALQAVQNIIADGRTVLFISDFYLPASALIRLLEGLGFEMNARQIYVSCDHMASKRSGRLYIQMLEDLRIKFGVAPSEIVMVGDNVHADVAMARQHGMKSVHVDVPLRKSFYASPQASVKNLTAARLKIDAVLAGVGVPRHARFAIPALVQFIELLYRQARRNGWRHLFFLAREGQPLQTMFESYQNALGIRGDRRIQTHYLEIPRRAAFVASLAPIGQERFNGLFPMYRHISLREFLRSLCVADSVVDRLARELDTAPDLRIDNFPSSNAFVRLCGLSSFQTLYEQNRISQRDLLTRYVAGFGVPLDTHPLVLVDVGWKGSIQDFLTRALPQVDVHGLYLGLFSMGQPLDQKTGVLFSNVGGARRGFFVYTECCSLFEMILCADHGSPHNYVDDGAGGVRVELDKDQEELARIRRELLPVRDDLLRAFDEVCALRGRFVLDDTWWECFAIKCFAEIIFRPWLPVIGWLAGAKHRENLGTYTSSSVFDGRTVSLIDRLRYLWEAVIHGRRFLCSSLWPAHTISCHLGVLAGVVYGGYRQYRDHRLPPPHSKD